MLSGFSTPSAGVSATVAICAFNAVSRIQQVLDGLAAQNLAPGSWEVLIVDNASSDGTGEYAEAQTRRLLKCQARVVREETPGLAFARRCASLEAKGKIICFLDDDNVPAPDFVTNAIRAFELRPAAGAIGGKVLPVWETSPSLLALAVQNFALAICDMGDVPFRHPVRVGPVGAGLCVRTNVIQTIYSKQKGTMITGHTGKKINGGDDLAIGILTWQQGYECWYDPSMVIRHLLPAGRMQKEYLLKLYEGIGRGQADVRRFYDWKARTPLSFLIGIKDGLRWLRGEWSGPPPSLYLQHPTIAQDLHQLNQRLVLGRSQQAMYRRT